MPKVLSKLKQQLPENSKLFKPLARKRPVWDGPEANTPNGGITFSLLSRFLVCRERFRCLVVEGLKPVDTFNSKLEFGNMWHVCEEALAKRYPYDPGAENPTWRMKSSGATNWWMGELREYCEELCQRYSFQQDQIAHWGAVAQALFPLYVDHWSKHPDVTARTPLLQEQVFDVPYSLPSERIVRLRGKWDSVDLIGKGEEAGVYIQENKTKSQIDGVKIGRQLRFDLQTMLYLIALQSDKNTLVKLSFGKVVPIRGVRYNIIRRSAHKTPESMLKKVIEDREHGRIGEWFARWKVEIGAQDLERFKHECLNPILENLCWWWDLQSGKACELPVYAAHWRHPLGVYNILDEGGSSELDSYLDTGSESGLQRYDNLFLELS